MVYSVRLLFFGAPDFPDGIVVKMPFAGLLVPRFRAEFVLDAQAIGHKGRNQLLLFRA